MFWYTVNNIMSVLGYVYTAVLIASVIYSIFINYFNERK